MVKVVELKIEKNNFLVVIPVMLKNRKKREHALGWQGGWTQLDSCTRYYANT